mgnify:CR=1 FL=1
MQKYLSPRQFAEAIGVSESSVRRWADDGQIQIARTAGGHRKILRTEAIRFIRETSADVLRPDLLEISEPNHRFQRSAAFGAQHDQLFKALKRGDAEIVNGLLIRMYLNGVSVAEICDGPIRHAMYKIGTMWPKQKRAILVEHRATSICIDALHQLRSTFAKSTIRRNAVAVGGAPENDPYVLPSLMVTTVLADVGYRAVNLGPNTPLTVISQSASELNAKLAWISFTSPVPKAETEVSLQQAAKRLSRKKTHLAVGGQASSKYQLPSGKHTHAFRSLSEMADFAKTLLSW